MEGPPQRDLRKPSSTLLLILIALAVATVVFPDEGHSRTYLPLEVGNRWEYTSPEGIEAQEVTGTVEIWGEEVYVIEYPKSVWNLDLQNYWTENDEGDVYIWGAWLEDEGWGLVYDPPILLVDAPLYLEKTWSQVTDIYELPDTTYWGQVESHFRVYWKGMLSVPAGEFYSYGIGQYLPPEWPAFGYRDLTGQIVDHNSDDATRWFSEGVGKVQYRTSDFYELVSFDFPIPVAETTWGAVKALYLTVGGTAPLSPRDAVPGR